VTRLVSYLPILLLVGGCGALPSPEKDASRRSSQATSRSSETERDAWPTRIHDAEESYRAGLDAYNAGEFGGAETAFQRGLERLDSSSARPTNEMDIRRRDLLMTKLSYFLRQANEQRESAEAVVLEVEEEEARFDPADATISDYPLEMNPRVVQQLDFFRSDISERIQVYISRSGRYAPMIRQELRENGLPQDLMCVSLIESGFSPNAYSRAHAVGLWQFIQSTGKLYGLKVDKWVDERRDPQKATRAAVRHLKDLRVALGDWNLALAAYNCGQSRVTRAIEKQGTRNFWQLDLPRQTEEYVPRFMAAVYIANDPKAHGFQPVYDPPIEHETLLVNRSIRLSRISEICGVPIDEIRALNPSLRRDVTPPDRAGFELHLPLGKSEVLSARLDEVPTESEPRSTIASASGSRTHVVRRGETLSQIARDYGTTHQAIAKANRMRAGSVIRSGQRLRIPGGATDSAGDPATPETSRTEVAKATGRTAPPARDAAGKGTAPAPAQNKTHTVRRGETIGQIARRYGMTPEDVLRWNGLSSRDRIHPGQRIRLTPNSSSGAKKSPGERTYTVQPGDNLWSIARRFNTTVEEILGLNRLNPRAILHPGSKIRVVERGVN